MRVSRDDLASRTCRLVFALVMAFTWCGGVNVGTRAASAGDGSAARPGPDDMKPVADEIRHRLDALQWVADQIPRETFDLQAVLGQTDKSPDRIFQWVRDQTSWVPYRGLLRGDQGVLMDRVGNSLDRSMLLYALLRAAGGTPRLAHAVLDDSSAKELLRKVRGAPRKAVAATQRGYVPDDAAIDKCARQSGMDAAVLRMEADRVRLDESRRARDVVARVHEQTAALAAAFGQPPGREDFDARDLAAIGDHWWVQIQDGTAWKDLDPMLADAKPGDAAASATQTLQPERLTDLSAADLHILRINVVVGYWKNGQVKEVPVLKRELLPAGLIGQRIALRQTPLHWPTNADMLAAGDPVAAFEQAALAQDEWMPVLTVGSQKICRYCFNDAGDLGDNTLPTFAQNALAGRKLVHAMEQGSQDVGAGVGGMLGHGRIGSAGAARNDPGPAPGKLVGTQLTGEWIDYEIQSPGRPLQKIRREIFDLLGPGAPPKELALTHQQLLERNLAMLGETEILPLVCQLSPAFVQDLQVRWALANRQALEELPLKGNLLDRKDVAWRLGALSPPPTPCLDLALARWEYAPADAGRYLASPNVIAHHVTFRPTADGGMAVCRGFDIVANPLELTAATTADPFAIRMEQGVLDTAAEASLLRGCGRIENAGEIFATAEAREAGWVTIRSHEDAEWSTVALPAGIKARIARDLAAGYVCVVPTKPVVLHEREAVAWWTIDPKTGQTLGMGARGWGEAEEYFGMTNEAWATVGIVVISFTIWINCATNPEKTSSTDQMRCAAIGLSGVASAGFGPFVAALVAGIPAVIDSFIDKYNATHKEH
jgi:hypothetical protein